MTGLENTLAVIIANKISDFAASHNKIHILDEVSIYGSPHPDGASTMSFEWHGTEDAKDFAREVLGFFEEIKKIVVSMGKEAIEQASPHFSVLKDTIVVSYRLRVWPVDGKYDVYERKLVTN